MCRVTRLAMHFLFRDLNDLKHLSNVPLPCLSPDPLMRLSVGFLLSESPRVVRKDACIPT